MLLITAGQRPASVYHRGGEVRIDIHDAMFTRTNGQFLADLQAMHPDTMIQHNHRRRYAFHGSRKEWTGYGFASVMRTYKAWLAKEKKWYAVFGLLPPKSRKVVHRTGAIKAPQNQYSRQRRIQSGLGL